MTLVNIKDIKVTFSQNVLYQIMIFFVENSKSQKNDFSWVFTERVTNHDNFYIWMNYPFKISHCLFLFFTESEQMSKKKACNL